MVEQNSPIYFSEWLKRRRKALDMTQDELARRAGCSVGALRKIESGDRRPSKQLAGLLAEALEIPKDEQQTFVRIARGELNLERLGQPSRESAPPPLTLANSHTAGSRATLPPVPTPPAPIHRIPAQATPLIGREGELAALERLFGASECRLLTLTGIGGIGKTRLAIEFAERKQAEFPGGVFYIPLTPVNSAEKIVPAIAEVLGLGFSGPSDPKEQLLNHIANHIRERALFVFDNLEHLLLQSSMQDDRFSMVELTAEFLERLPNVKLLGTSRERLNIHGEWTYELYGLGVPPTHFVGQLEAYDAIALFVKSAQRIQPDFRATGEDEPYLIQIAQLVEGVPLAIELAAAWAGMLTCQEIAREMQSNMDFLTTSMRNIPERHRSMRAAFDHSWKLLSDDERCALCQLAVFHGGFDRSAAQQIAGASLPLLASLSAKSLVRRTESMRYDLHEVIRQYAASHLNDQPFELETHTRHCEYYLSFVRERECMLKSGAQQEAIQQLTGEIDNIRAAWVWAIEHKKFDLLGQAGRGFGWYYEITGLYREGIDQLELLVQALKSGPPEEECERLLGLTLIHQGLLYFRKGEFIQARQHYEDSIRLLRLIGEVVLLADALVFLGTILYLNGEYEGARSLMQEGLILARQSGERWFEAWAIYNSGHIDSLVGRYEQGYEQLMAGIGMWREIGDPQVIALGLNFLVTTLIQLGRFAEAENYMYESIALCEQSQNHWGRGTAYRYLGLTYLAEGKFAEAQAHLLRSLEIFGEFSVGWDIARSLTYLGDAALLGGELPEARKYYREGLKSAIEARAIPIALDALLGLAYLQAQAGQEAVSLLLCYFILHHDSSGEDTKRRAGKLAENTESTIGSEEIKEMRRLALERTLDQVAKEALGAE